MLAFGKWDNAGSIESSDNIVSIPVYNQYSMNNSYLTWTTYAFEHKDKNFMLAFGGQTFETIWDFLSTSANREFLAANMKTLLDTQFPVYKKGLESNSMVGDCLSFNWNGSACEYNNYQLAGYATLAGIAFDFEKKARITEIEGQNLTDFITLLRKKIPSGKLLSLTTYHVGADPINCSDNTVTTGCSFIDADRSIHNGEVLEVLKSTKILFDFFNIMAYDSGKDYLYQTAIENYGNAIGDPSKIILGLTINSQWGANGNFVESDDELKTRTQWQKDNGYGGVFLWTLGANTEQRFLIVK